MGSIFLPAKENSLIPNSYLMKRIFFVFSLLLAAASTTLSATDNNPSTLEPSPMTLEVEIVEEVSAEEALYCKIERADGSTYTCWFCPCPKDAPAPAPDDTPSEG